MSSEVLCLGWLYGAAHGHVGMFPKEYVISLARYEVEGERVGGSTVTRIHIATAVS